MTRTPATVAKIAQLNDLARTAMGVAGRMFQTAGIADLPATEQSQIREAVERFNDWNKDNDPYGEHDFGALDVAGHRVMWKIDYYDKTCENGSEDPSDPRQTTRVLTIMLAEEYEMVTKKDELVAKVRASGWEIRPDTVIVWASNGDDQLILTAAVEAGWLGQWLYRDDVRPVGPTLSFADVEAVLAHLATADPTCVRCGYQGHSSPTCEETPAPGTATLRTPAEWAAKITAAVVLGKTEILAEIASGRIPATVNDFSQLHDYVDANEFGGLCDGSWLQEYPVGHPSAGEMTNESQDAASAVQDQLHQWLQDGRR